ncbi:MAG: acyloxyacyl hydrolase [Pseudomonadota bacterium]
MATFTFATTPALAQEDLLSFGAGWYDIMDDDSAADFRLEYRPDQKIFWEFKPWVGGEVTSEASVWGGGGILLDLNISDSVYITPSFGAGLYTKGGSDLDLDFPIQFRSQIEAGMKFDGGQRVGLSFGHLSNASLGDSNPGTEVLNLYYHVPYGNFFN